MTPPLPDIIEVMTRFSIASQLYQSRSETRLAPMGLTLSQLSVLTHLARRQAACRVTDIARAVEVGQPAVTKMLKKFEREGWIEPVHSDHDKRSKSVVITPRGGAHVLEVQKTLMPELGAFFAQWAPQDIAQFTDHLTRFGAFLDQNRLLDDAT